MLKLKYVTLMLMLLLSLVGAKAQLTTASLSGKVTDSQNAEIIGATISAKHNPSGTVYYTITNADGRYSIQGMRVGGPYTIEVSFIGYATSTTNNVTLQLGENQKVNATLQEDNKVLDEVVVVSNADANKTGAGMSMRSDRMDEVPSLTNNIADYARLSPQVRINENGAMMFAGTSNRYNSFQIDGAVQNDVFGLTSNGQNGGQAGGYPVSMETIDQIQIAVAPFDVRQGGFTGGAVNAVTKSGTNQFHGSAYARLQNKGLIGKTYTRMNGTDADELGKQHDNTFGATVGGPIIKDKLFFFVNFEHHNKAYDNVYGPKASGSKVDGDLAYEVLDFVKSQAAAQGVNYSGKLGTPEEYTKGNQFGLKLDWNITDKHHASFRYALSTSKQLNQTSSASKLHADTYAYDFVSKTNTFTFELNSRFNEKMANELRVAYVNVRDKREPGQAFPMIEIANVGGGTLELGNERSSMANSLDQDSWTITDNFTLYLNKNTLTFGTHDEFYKFGNLFIQDAYGSYFYTGGPVKDENGNITSLGKLNRFRFGMANTDVTGDPRWQAEFGAGQLGFYVQDKWSATDNFDLTAGLRVDIPLFLDTPAENTTFNADAEAMGWDVKTNQKLSSKPMWSPRLGFNYDVLGTRALVIRGGVGIFTGRVPYVWLSNNFSNTGVQTVSYDTGNGKAGDRELIYSTNPLDQMVNAPISKDENGKFIISPSAQTINVFKKDFKFPQNMRVNLAVDGVVAGVKLTAEMLYSKTLNDMMVEKLSIAPTGQTLADKTGLDFDNRPMYQDKIQVGANKYSAIYKLTNTNKGNSLSLSFKADKSIPYALGTVDLSASYTYTKSETVNGGGSSVAASNWQYNYTKGNPNDPELAPSQYCYPHRVLASAYINICENQNERISNKTTVGLIYEGSSGQAYSIYYYNDLNGDNGSNDLMFIPTDEQIDQMLEKGLFLDGKLSGNTYTAAEQAEAMKQWLANESGLKDHRGEYSKRYGFYQDFVNRFDLHADHKFGFKVGNQFHYITVGFDMLNLGNAFNKEWGRTFGNTSYYSPVTISSGKYQFLQKGDYQMRNYADYYSRWRGQFTIKYTF